MIANRPLTRRRPGSILPLVALLLVCLCGFTALSVEVATIATVKTQCQNAADAAALAGARTLNGGTTPSTSQAQANALAAASANSALGMNASGQMALVGFESTEVGSTCGTYHYSTSSQTFAPSYSLQSGENYNLVRSSVQRQIKNTFFAAGGGSGSAAATPTITATAVASHRPRDVAIVLDFSGSMNNESDLWNCESYLGSLQNLSNNSDPVVPTFGHYSSSSAAIVSSSAFPGGSCNITQPVYGTPALVNSFFQTLSSVIPGTGAFTAAPTSYGTGPLGDAPLTKVITGSSAYGQTLNQILGTSYTTSYQAGSYADDWEGSGTSSAYGTVLGYDAADIYYSPPPPSGQKSPGVPGFSGYTQGPGYWGKTFFIWPPDPRAAKDWRQLYFLTTSGGPVNDNTVLWNPSNQSWNPPYGTSTNYQINYKAILNWIKNVGPNPFPPMLQAGRIVFYSSIPNDVPASAYNHGQSNGNITDPSQRFWKEYIDFCLGVWRDPFGNVQAPGNPSCSYGPDYNWGPVQISARPGGPPPNGSKLAYMNYNDNPPRPRHRMWFGPMTMLQYIADTGLNPGTARDISTYSAKLGIASVLQDIQVNHPNDLLAMILYNRPQYSNEPPIGNFNQALYNLSTDYSAMANSLWYPPGSSTAGNSPWDSVGSQTPNSYADFIANTTTQHGLMIAYNQFSGSSTLSSAGVGGLGRVGAKKLVILETDGMANNNTNAGFVNAGAGNSYYNILPKTNVTASNYDQNNLLQVVQAICNTGTGAAGTANSVVSNPGYPGFATASKPVVVQTVAFGIVFEIATSTQSNAVGLLQAISLIGGTTFPSSSNDPTNGFKWCIGPLSTRVQLLQQAFANLLNDGDSVSIIQ